MSGESPQLAGPKILVGPSAACEVCWLLYNLNSGLYETRPLERAPLLASPLLAARARNFWNDGFPANNELAVLAHLSGTLTADDFGTVLAGLPKAARSAVGPFGLSTETPLERTAINRRMEQLKTDEQLLDRYCDLLADVWSAALPLWEYMGKRAVMAAVEVWRQKCLINRLIDLLAPSHVVRLLGLEAMLMAAVEQGRVTVLPGYFSSATYILAMTGVVALGVPVDESSSPTASHAGVDRITVLAGALAEKDRVSLLLLLLEAAASVRELAERSHLSTATVRRHLKVLEAQALVERTKVGAQVTFKAIPEQVDRILDDISARLLRNYGRASKLNAALLESQSSLRTIFAASPSPIIEIDSQGVCVACNPAAEKTLGYAERELTTLQWQYLVTEDEEVQPQDFGTREITLRRKDGTTFPARVVISNVERPSGDLAFMYALIEDLTERRRAEEASRELGRQAKELARAKQIAEAATAAKAVFLATMSHEIRTPMNAIVGMSSMLMDTSLTTDQTEYAQTIRTSGDHLLTIINDILDFSKLEAGKIELENAPFDLRQTIEEALSLVGEAAAVKNLNLAYVMDKDIPRRLRGDRARLRQVLINLLTNAIKFTSQGEVAIELSTRAVGREQEISMVVRDTGIGIPADRLDRLFKAFSQVDASTARQYGGTGLGLAISKQLCELMGGTIEVSSNPGVGSTFAATIRAPSVDLPKTTVIESPVQLRGLRALIIDHNMTNCRMLLGSMEEWEMDADAIATPANAAAWAQGGKKVDLVLFDPEASELDPMSRVQELRESVGSPSTRFVLLSSSHPHLIDPAGVFDAVLTKPIRQAALRDTLLAASGFKPSARSGPASEFDPELAARLPLCILLVDDNQTNQRVAKLMFGKFGYAPDIASSGQDAIAALALKAYDVLFMDMEMPDMDGLEATRHIRAGVNLAAQRPRIVAMTGNATPEDRERCMAAGMDDYLAKPVKPAQLAAALLACATDHRAAAGTPSTTG